MQATIGIVPGVGAGPRIRMMADQTFTVAASGGDDTNIAGPFATKQGAMDMIQKEYDLNGYIATIQVEDGADSTGFLTYRGAPFGAAKTDETPIKLRGNNTTPSNCPITIASGTCIHVTAGARIQMSGFKLTAGTGTCLLGAVHSFISVDGPVEFGTAGTHISAASNCNIHISGAYTISGGGGRHVRAVSGSTVFLTGIATISAPITFTAAFLEGVQGGVAGFQNAGAVNPGNVTGPRFNQQNGGIVYSTASTGLQAIPGTSDGVYTNDVGFKPSITVASAATLNLMPVTSGISGNFINLTGTVTITSLGSAPIGTARWIRIAAAGGPKFTYSPHILLDCNSNLDLQTYPGDTLFAIAESTLDGTERIWRIVAYHPSAAALSARYQSLGVLAGINTQTGTAYTLVLTDVGKVVEMNNAATNTLTIPPNSSVAFSIGTRIDLLQLGAGQTTIAPGAGVTIRQRQTFLKLAGQYAVASLYKRAADEWVLRGDLSA
jgi:hypothetical protein